MRGALVVAALAGASCHTVLISVERRSSSGLVYFEPARPKRSGFDGHAVFLPAIPLTNCYDLLGDVDLSKYRGDRAETCKGTRFTTDFVGLWLEPPEMGEQRSDGRHLAPRWLRGTNMRHQLVRASWILDEYGGWTDQPRYAVVRVTPGGNDDIEVVLDRPLVKKSECLLIKKWLDPGIADNARLHRTCGIYGYPIDFVTDETTVVVSARAIDNEVTNCDLVDAVPELSRRNVLVDRLRIHAGDQVIVERCDVEPRSLVSFVHISDAQIREPGARLVNRELSRRLDRVIPSFEHDFEQELFSPFYYGAIIATINAEVESTRPTSRREAYRLSPSFLVHTGDAVDAGLVTEFNEFYTRTNELRIPWYQVVGNHDVLAFGNLKMTRGHEQPACTETASLLEEYYLTRPRGNDDREYRGIVSSKPFSLVPALIGRICLDQHILGDALVAQPRGNLSALSRFVRAHCDPDEQERCRAHDNLAFGTRYHRAQHGFGDNTSPGYYAFVPDLPGQTPGRLGGGVSAFVTRDAAGKTIERKVWVVVLNTATPDGAFGAVDDAQLAWLESLLPPAHADDRAIARDDLVVVFAHHPIWGIASDATRQRLERLFSDAGNVVAYFAGHTHAPGLRAVPYRDRAGAAACPSGGDPSAFGTCGFWEVIAPSTLAFPQHARQVTLKVMPQDRLGYFDLLAFSPQLDEPGDEYVQRAMAGADRDHCANGNLCEHGRPVPPPHEHMFARLFFRLPQSATTHVAPKCVPPHVTDAGPKRPLCK